MSTPDILIYNLNREQIRMTEIPKFPQRKSIRLPDYDYSQEGLYFITVCTQNRVELFGQIENNIIVGAHHDAPDPGSSDMVLNEYGEIIKSVWESLPKRFPIEPDTYQIMPNHLHSIVNIRANRAIRESPLRKRSLLSQIIGYFKMNSTKIIHNINSDISVWQRNYYEHVIRNEQELEKIRLYIETNPQMWFRDRNNPEKRPLEF